jgi:signal transduction histidine kinase
VASAGLRVDLVRTGARWPLSRAMDLTAYRVLQESLTNVVRHAGTEDAWVRIEYSPDRLTLRVRDRGRGRQAASPGGTGQLGMRERLAIWGGTLEAGDAPDGGYEVVAVLPRGQEEES